MQNKLSTILFEQLKQFNENLPTRHPKLLENYLRPNQLLSCFAQELLESDCGIQVLACQPCLEHIRIQLINPETQSPTNQDMELLEVLFEGEIYWVVGGMQWKYAAESQNVPYEPDSPLDIGDINELSIYSITLKRDILAKMQEMIQSCREPTKIFAFLSLLQ